jgi:alpha-tubulin suppressor-like RCC1 family protein
MDNVIAVAAGYRHCLIIKSDSSLWRSGSNFFGQLGDGTLISKSSFVKVLDDVKEISTGFDYSLALKNDGTLWSTGNNLAGQLGDGTGISQTRFVKINIP